MLIDSVPVFVPLFQHVNVLCICPPLGKSKSFSSVGVTLMPKDEIVPLPFIGCCLKICVTPAPIPTVASSMTNIIPAVDSRLPLLLVLIVQSPPASFVLLVLFLVSIEYL